MDPRAVKSRIATRRPSTARARSRAAGPDLHAGSVHPSRRDLGVVHDHLDRETVDQRREPERELLRVLGGGELAAGLTPADQVGQLRPPTLVEHLAVLGHLGVAERADPDLDPQRPLVETAELGQVRRDREIDEPPQLVLRRGDPADLARGAQVELVVRERERLGQQTILRLEVVRTRPGETPASSAMSEMRVSASPRSVMTRAAASKISWCRSLPCFTVPVLTGSAPVERGPVLGRGSPVFEPEFSNSTPLTWPVNRRDARPRLTGRSNAWQD